MPTLSARQHQVVELLAEGLLNKEIAVRLGMSEAGVKKHLSRLMRDHGVSTRTALLSAAIRRGEIGL